MPHTFARIHCCFLGFFPTLINNLIYFFHKSCNLNTDIVVLIMFYE